MRQENAILSQWQESESCVIFSPEYLLSSNKFCWDCSHTLVNQNHLITLSHHSPAAHDQPIMRLEDTTDWHGSSDKAFYQLTYLQQCVCGGKRSEVETKLIRFKKWVLLLLMLWRRVGTVRRRRLEQSVRSHQLTTWVTPGSSAQTGSRMVRNCILHKHCILRSQVVVNPKYYKECTVEFIFMNCRNI